MRPRRPASRSAARVALHPAPSQLIQPPVKSRLQPLPAQSHLCGRCKTLRPARSHHRCLGNNTVVGPLSGSSGNQPFTQIQGPPQKYVFYLWNFTGGSKGAQLASVPVAATGSTERVPPRRVNPARNTPGSTSQSTAAGWPPAGNGVRAGAWHLRQFCRTNQRRLGWRLQFPYTTQASNAIGLYTAWPRIAAARNRRLGRLPSINRPRQHSDMPEQYNNLGLQWRPN